MSRKHIKMKLSLSWSIHWEQRTVRHEEVVVYRQIIRKSWNIWLISYFMWEWGDSVYDVVRDGVVKFHDIHFKFFSSIISCIQRWKKEHYACEQIEYLFAFQSNKSFFLTFRVQRDIINMILETFYPNWRIIAISKLVSNIFCFIVFVLNSN